MTILKCSLLLLLTTVTLYAQTIYGPGRGGVSGSGSGVTVPLQGIVYVAPNGDDANAVLGNSLYPYQSIKAAFAAATNNCLILVYPGQYAVTPSHIADPVTEDLTAEACAALQNLTNVTVRGYGATIFGSGQGNLLNLKNVNRLTIEGIRFKSDRPVAHPTLTTPLHAMVYPVHTNQFVTFKDCTFEDFYNHGVASPLANTARANSFFSFDNCRFLNGGNTNTPTIGYDGASIALVARTLDVTGCTFTNVLRGVEIEGIEASTRDQSQNIVENCTFVDVWEKSVFALATVPGTIEEDYQGFIVANNKFDRCGRSVVHRTGTSTACAAVYMGQGVGAQIIGNYIRDGLLGVYLQCASSNAIRNVSIIGNGIRNMGTIGIVADEEAAGDSLNGIIIAKNTIEDCGGYGIQYTGDDGLIQGNILKGNGWITGTYGASGQIRIAAFSSRALTNVLVKENFIGDSATNATHSIAISVSSTCLGVDILENRLSPRLNVLTTAIQHNGSGTIDHTSYLTTTDATVTTTYTLTPVSGSTILFDIEAIGNGTSAQTITRRLGGYKNVGGTVTALTLAPSSTLFESGEDPLVVGNSHSISGATVLHRVAGLASTTINWKNRTRISIVK